MTEKVNISLVPPSDPRDGSSLAKDSYILNGMVEADRKYKYITRRPGILQAFTVGSNFTIGNGFFFFNGFYYATGFDTVVNNDFLFRSSGTANSGTNGAAFTATVTPPWSAPVQPQCVVFEDRIYMLGSLSGTGSVANGAVWSTPDGLNWTLNTAGTGANRFGHRCCVFNGLIFMMGGFSAGTGAQLSDVLSSPDGTNWTQVTNTAPWGARSNFGLVSTNNGMFLFGGQNATPVVLNDVWFSSDGAQWTQISAGAPWAARSNMVALWFNDLVWCIGGSNFNDVWSSPDGITWTRTTSGAFDTGRFGQGGTVYNAKMWVMGGAVAGVATSQVWSSPDGITWTVVTGAPGWSAREYLQVVAFRTPSTVSQYRYPTLWVIGGSTGALSPLRDVYYGNINIQTAASYNLNPTVAQVPYQFTTYMNGTKLVFKNTSNCYVLDSGNLTRVVDSSYPATTVPGIVTLDAFVHVCTPEGEVHSCKLDDPTLWPSLQYITADYEDDPAVAITKHQNYLVVLSKYTTQFFYDAGTAEGSELLPNQSANQKIGCAAGNTVVQMDNTTYFLSITQGGKRQVSMLNGIAVTPVSTPYIDKWLMNPNSTNSTMSAMSWTGGGHSFYIITDSAVFWAYDTTTKIWSEWALPDYFANDAVYCGGAASNQDAGGQFVLANSATLSVLTVFEVDATFLNDNGVAYTVTVQTEKEDAGISARKFWGRTTLLADQTAAPTTTDIQTTDDDYQTYIDRGTVNEATDRPSMHRTGSSRHRAWKLSRTDSQTLRWRELEVEFSTGES